MRIAVGVDEGLQEWFAAIDPTLQVIAGYLRGGCSGEILHRKLVLAD